MASLPIRDPKNDHLLTPENSVLVIVDYQPTMVQSVNSTSRSLIVQTIGEAGKLAKGFNVPVVISSINVNTGVNPPVIPQIMDTFPEITPIDRTSINAYEDKEFKAAVDAHEGKKIIICGLWTEACLSFPALDLLAQGREVYTIVEAVGGPSKESHDLALRRLEKAGLIPISITQLTCEWQRDWSRTETVPTFIQPLIANGAFLGGSLIAKK